MDRLKDEKGTETVEFAIVSMLLFLLLFGIIEFSIFLYNKAVITNASREGARAGIVARYDNSQTPAAWDPLDTGEIEAIVNQYCLNHLISFGPGASPKTTVTGTTESVTGERTVTVTYKYYFLLSKLFGLGPSLDLAAVTVMRME